jgi:hypothetical protein
MRTKVRPTAQRGKHLSPFIMRNWHVCIVVTAWLLTPCISMHAQDSTPAREHARTRAPQKNVPNTNVPNTKDGETKIANEAGPALCVIKPDDPGIATKAGAALPKESDGRDGMSKENNEATSGENLSLQPAQQEWGKDQIHLGVETNGREESRREKSESSGGSELKCTPHEGTANTEPAIPN